MGRALSWLVSIFFGIGAIASFSSMEIGPAIFAAVVALVALPPLWASPKLSKVPSGARWALAIGALILIGATAPHDSSRTTAPNSPTPVNGKEAATTAKAPVQKDAADPTTDTAAQPATRQSNWQYDDSYDEMRKKYTYTACVKSDNQLNFGFPYWGGSSGILCFRNSPQFGKDAYLTIDGGQFDCSFEGCTVHIKFDDGPIHSYGASMAADGSTDVIFIHGYSNFLRSIQKSKSMIVETAYFQAGQQQLKFSVIGLDWKH